MQKPLILVSLLCFTSLGLASCEALLNQLPRRSSSGSSKTTMPGAELPPTGSTGVRVVDASYIERSKDPATKVDISSLIAKRLAIPRQPRLPDPPAARLVNASAIANVAATLSAHTEEPILSKGARVAVVTGVVGQSSTPGKFVGDLMFNALQRGGIQLVDRDYVNLAAKEQDLADAKRIDISEGKSIILAKDVDFVVFLHRVDNPQPHRQLHVPLEITDEEWKRYTERREEYDAAREAYNIAVHDYDEACRTVIRDSGDGIEATVAAALETRELLRLLDLKRQIEGTTAVRAYREQIQAEEASTVKAAAPARPQATAEGGAAFDPRMLTEWMTYMQGLQTWQETGGAPTAMPKSSKGLYQDPSEALVGNDFTTPQIVSTYQAGVSARVINLKTMTAEWFGVASAQNMDYAQALGDCCRRLADAMISK